MAGFSNTPEWLDMATKEMMGASQERTNRPTSSDWIPPGKSVVVAGVELPDGMIYLGERLTPVESWFGNVEPALINPRLRIDRTPRTNTHERLGYRVAYANLSPQHRIDYLHWLATGRRNPKIGIDFVRLFFFGLERRVIHDLHQEFDTPGDPELVRQEIRAIADEVRGLVDAYRYEADFVTQATEFVSVLQAITHDYPTPPKAPPSAASRWDIPEYLRFNLGCFAKNDEPIPALWALRWLQTSPNARFRTPSKRCPQEFADLWKYRYTERFGNGLTLTANAYNLTLDYRPDTWSMIGVFEIPTTLPNVVMQKGPMAKLTQLAADCEDELIPYSRYVGSAHAERNSVAARALLPAPLIDGGDQSLTELKTKLQGAIDRGDPAVVHGPALIRLWNGTTAPLSKSDAAAFAHLLGALGYGVEPDVRFGGKPLGGTKAVIFKSEQVAESATPAYNDATVLVDLAYFVLASDGTLSPSDMTALESLITSLPGLTTNDHDRLAARMVWLSTAPPTLNGVKGRLRHVTYTAPEMGHRLIGLAVQGLGVPPATMTALTKVFRLLQLDESALYSDVHQAHIRHAPGKGADYTPPHRATRATSTGFHIDMDRVHATIAESHVVSDLLGEIFTEDDAPAPPSPVADVDTDTGNDPGLADVEGLDAPHSAFLRELATKAQWSVGEVAQLSERLRLLPSGAIDTLNEVAFDRIGDPVVEGDGDITVDLGVAQELLD